MPAAVQPILVTPDVDRLHASTAICSAPEQVERYPEDGAVFFVELRIGDAGLGIVANTDVETGTPGRVLLSIEVDAPSTTCCAASSRWAARRRASRTTCRGDSASPTSRTPTATPST